MTTQEGNKLIFMFMGATEMHVTTSPNGVKTIHSARLGQLHINDFDKLQYHYSWNMLMPVVEKIESIEIKKGCNPVVTIETGYCVISNNGEEPIVENQIENKIESVWQAVINFINWYNAQTK